MALVSSKSTEAVYIVPGSDAEDYLARRFPHKKTRRVQTAWRAISKQES